MGNELPTRKHPRLKGYDYNQTGAYFITICVKDRRALLGEVIVGRDDPGTPKTNTDTMETPNMPHAPHTNPIVSDTSITTPKTASFVRLSEYGKIVQKNIDSIESHYKHVFVDKYVIMPNHIHNYSKSRRLYSYMEIYRHQSRKMDRR